MKDATNNKNQDGSAEALPRLQQLQQNDNRMAFDRLMEKELPKVIDYINRQLNVAINNKTLSEGNLKAEDIIDQLYIEAFDNIQNLTEKHELHHWVFIKADELLADAMVEEDFNHTFFNNIDNYANEEWEGMEENYTSNGEGHFLMLEELDDISYSKHDYSLADVFIENIEEDLFNKLSNKLSEQDIQRQIESALHSLPFHPRTIFELAVNQKFEIKEIADIKKMTIQEVEEILTKAKGIIRTNFINNHLS